MNTNKWKPAILLSVWYLKSGKMKRSNDLTEVERASTSRDRECEICHELFKGVKGLNIHKSKMHNNLIGGPPGWPCSGAPELNLYHIHTYIASSIDIQGWPKKKNKIINEKEFDFKCTVYFVFLKMSKQYLINFFVCVLIKIK